MAATSTHTYSLGNKGNKGLGTVAATSMHTCSLVKEGNEGARDSGCYFYAHL